LLAWVELDPQWGFEDQAARELVGVPLGESGLRRKHHVTVVSVRPEGRTSFTPAGMETVLTYGAVIVLAGRPDAVERFGELR